jgi:hypothetical protein
VKVIKVGWITWLGQLLRMEEQNTFQEIKLDINQRIFNR